MKAVEVQVLRAGIFKFQNKLKIISDIFSYFSGGTGSLYRNGTCFTAIECQDKGGQASGSCAAG